MKEPRDHEFRFEWVPAEENGKPFDYMAKERGRPIGHIYKLTRGPAAGRWYWAMSAQFLRSPEETAGGLIASDHGVVGSFDEACRFIEKSYSHLYHRAIQMGLLT